MKTLRSRLLGINRSSFRKERIIISAFLLIMLITMSTGYALYYSENKIIGAVTVVDTAGVRAVKMTTGASSNVTAGSFSYTRTYTDTTTNIIANTKASFTGYGPYVEYVIEIANFSSSKTYYYQGMTNSVTFRNIRGQKENMNSPMITGLNPGDEIKPGETLSFTMRYYYNGYLNGTYTFDAQTIFKFVTDASDVTPAKIATALDKNEFELDKSNIANFTLKILNLYDTSIEYTLALSNTNIEFIDADGNPFTYTGFIDAGSEATIPFYVHIKDGNDGFESMTTDLYVNLTGSSNENVGEITLYEYEDRATIKPSKAAVSFGCEPAANGSWANHYLCFFSIDNKSDEPINQWTVDFNLDSSMNILSIQNWNDEWSYNNTTKIFKWSSDYRYQPNVHRVIPSGGSYTSEQFIFEMTNPEFMVSSMRVYTDGEVDIFTDQYFG